MPTEIQSLLKKVEQNLEEGNLTMTKKTMKILVETLKTTKATFQELIQLEEIIRLAQGMQLIGMAFQHSPLKTQEWMGGSSSAQIAKLRI